MTEYVNIDGAGRIVIPKRVRERYGLRAGQVLELTDTGEDLRLRPKPDYAVERDSSGWVIFTDPLPEGFDVVDAIERQREERSRHVWGA